MYAEAETNPQVDINWHTVPFGHRDSYALEVLAQLLPRYIEMQIFEAVLQNIASFYSAQMVAMKNATDNAQDLVDDLTLTYNKARQEMITKEILDPVGGAAALEG